MVLKTNQVRHFILPTTAISYEYDTNKTSAATPPTPRIILLSVQERVGQIKFFDGLHVYFDDIVTDFLRLLLLQNIFMLRVYLRVTIANDEMTKAMKAEYVGAEYRVTYYVYCSRLDSLNYFELSLS